MSLNTQSELKDELRQINVEYSGQDLQRKLRQANNRLVEEVGRRFVEPKVIQFEDETTVDLDFNSLESLDKIVNVNGEGNEIIDASNYTEKLGDGTVDFTQSYVDDEFFEGLRLKFYHVPTVFKDLEVYLAARNILEQQSIQTTDGVNNTQVDRMNQRIEALIRRINSGNSTGVQSGDNTNIGSERPRQLGDS